MFAGAALWGASGTDLWHALDQDEMAAYLSATADVKPLLVANLSLWILGVLTLGVAGVNLVQLCRQRPATASVARVCFMTAVPLALVAFIAMLALVVQVGPSPSPAGLAVAEVVGWIGARTDDLATALIVGAGPFFIVLAGRAEWVPKWLVAWGYLNGVVALLSLASLYAGALSALGFLIVPTGIGWMLAVAVVLLRSGRGVPEPARAA